MRLPARCLLCVQAQIGRVTYGDSELEHVPIERGHMGVQSNIRYEVLLQAVYCFAQVSMTST